MYEEQIRMLKYAVVNEDGKVMAIFRNPHHAVIYARNYGWRVEILS